MNIVHNSSKIGYSRLLNIRPALNKSIGGKFYKNNKNIALNKSVEGKLINM